MTRLNIYLEVNQLIDIQLESLDLPIELRRIILLYSGHLRFGNRSVSWLLYF